VLDALRALPRDADPEWADLIEVRVLLDAPLPDLRTTLLGALDAVHQRLLKITRVRGDGAEPTPREEAATRALDPLALLEAQWQKTYREALPDPIRTRFERALALAQEA
jgi:DNA repair protein SbcD/Mre11